MDHLLLYLVISHAVVLLAAALARRLGLQFLTGLYVACILIATTIASKIVGVGSFALSATVLTYSMTFLITDMIGEFYGRRAAHTAVFVAFLADLLFAITVYAALRWPAASFWSGQEAMEATLGQTPRIVLASFTAYLAAQNSDVWSYHFLKDRFQGKQLWLRNLISTLFGQAIDTVLFYTIAFYGVFPVGDLILAAYLAKIGIAVFETPVMYATRWLFYRNQTASVSESTHVA